MQDSREVAQSVVPRKGEPGTEASPTTSATPAGPSDVDRQPLIEAINQVFALFRLNYHNQYYAAFPDANQLNLIKRLWLDTLADYNPEDVLRGAKHAIEHSEYLPTLNLMLESCQQCLAARGLPNPREAFVEACNRPSPKAGQDWSHPAVYLAGRDSDWFFLANNPERTTWPVFERHFAHYVRRASRGETLVIPDLPALPRDSTSVQSLDERKAALANLRKEMGL